MQKDRIIDKNYKKYIIPTVLITSAFYSLDENSLIYKVKIQKKAQNYFSDLHSPIDDYVLVLPVLAVYSFDIFDKETKNIFLEKSILLAKSTIFSYSFVSLIKRLTLVSRPDKSDNLSFPSGHTSNAFVFATFMHKELVEKSKWYSVGAYSVASFTALMRVINNEHWISDVLLGAGIGILTTNIVYKTHQYKWTKRKNQNLSFFPIIYGKHIGISLVYNL